MILKGLFELSWNPLSFLLSLLCFSLVGCFCLFIFSIFFSVSLVSAYSHFLLSYDFSLNWTIMTVNFLFPPVSGKSLPFFYRDEQRFEKCLHVRACLFLLLLEPFDHPDMS